MIENHQVGSHERPLLQLLIDSGDFQPLGQKNEAAHKRPAVIYGVKLPRSIGTDRRDFSDQPTVNFMHEEIPRKLSGIVRAGAKSIAVSVV